MEGEVLTTELREVLGLFFVFFKTCLVIFFLILSSSSKLFCVEVSQGPGTGTMLGGSFKFPCVPVVSIGSREFYISQQAQFPYSLGVQLWRSFMLI